MLKQSQTHLSFIDYRKKTGSLIITQEIDEFSLKLDEMENVLFFNNANPKYKIDKDEANAILVANKLCDLDWLDMFNRRWNLGVQSWDIDKMEKGKPIKDGYMIIVNMILTLLKYERVNLAVYNIESSLHRKMVNELVNYLCGWRRLNTILINTNREEWLDD